MENNVLNRDAVSRGDYPKFFWSIGFPSLYNRNRIEESFCSFTNVTGKVASSALPLIAMQKKKLEIDTMHDRLVRALGMSEKN